MSRYTDNKFAVDYSQRQGAKIVNNFEKKEIKWGNNKFVKVGVIFKTTLFSTQTYLLYYLVTVYT